MLFRYLTNIQGNGIIIIMFRIVTINKIWDNYDFITIKVGIKELS